MMAQLSRVLTFIMATACLSLGQQAPPESSPAPPAIRHDKFTSAGWLTLVGDAGVARDRGFYGEPDDAVRLTRAVRNQSGAVWLSEKQAVASGFDTTFHFQLTDPGGDPPGADGIAFVLQNSGPEALGGRGSAGGFAVTDPRQRPQATGIPWSFAVFFDTFQNLDQEDPSDNYVVFRTYGKPADMRWPAPRVASTQGLPVRLKDGYPHTARIVFQPPVLSVFLDGSPAPVLESVVDLSMVLDQRGKAWVGLTASTGGSWENQDVFGWSYSAEDVSSNVATVDSDISFSLSACLPDRKLCTPEEASVAPAGAGYHIVLPANREWGASVPNPSGRPVASTDAHGIVCWDVRERQRDGCSGPGGNGTAAGPAFLDPDSPAGALIAKTHDGRTWFSVNGRQGAFGDNQGFYEFNLEIK
jgi:hypothetical protein